MKKNKKANWKELYKKSKFRDYSFESASGKKVKPLYTLTERESASYCLIRGINYVEEECPNALGAHSLIYKDALNRIETMSPGSKQQFFQGFLERMQPTLQRSDPIVLKECEQCGQTTTGEVCSFCRMWNKARDLKNHDAATTIDPQLHSNGNAAKS